MTERWRWCEAERLAAEFAECPGERRILELLTRLPLVSAPVLAPLTGGGHTTTYRTLDHLRDTGLVDSIQPPFRPGHAPRLWYLTDPGLAVVALHQGTVPKQLAQRQRLRGGDLLDLLPGLPHLVATYEILRALAIARPGRPHLLVWERPWRRRFWRPTTRAPGRISFPAYCILSWPESTGAFLLLPDLGTSPPRAWRTSLAQLVVLRATQPDAVPPLVIATSDVSRSAVWHDLLAEVARSRRDAGLSGHVVLWSDLSSGLRQLPLCSGSPAGLERLDEQARGPGASPPSGLLPCLVGEALRSARGEAGTRNNLGCIARGLTAADRSLLDFVGHHPFLDPEQIRQTCGLQVARETGCLQRLIATGLLRCIMPGEADASRTIPELVELTRSGLAIVAAQQGLRISSAVRFNGLVGGGPERPFGARSALARNLVHTRGVDALFVELARQLARAGENAALVEWRNAAACARRSLRPDGYGIVCYRDRLHGFFLEYDRGTMRIPGYLKKLAAYYAYQVSGRFQHDYAGFPTILLVAANNGAESRIARAARAATVGRAESLPLLLTCQWRINDERNPHGFLGPIWRRPEADFSARQSWPPDPGSTIE